MSEIHSSLDQAPRTISQIAQEERTIRWGQGATGSFPESQ